MNDFFPRSYNLSYPTDLQTFLDDYHCLHAITSLKRLVEIHHSSEGTRINIGVFKTLIRVIKKCRYSVHDSFIDSAGFVEEQCFTSTQSKIIQNSDEWLYQVVSNDDFENYDCPVKELKSLLGGKKSNTETDDDKKNSRRRKKILKTMCQLIEVDQSHIDLAKMILRTSYDSKSLQSSINGIHSDNIWILKPTGKSRGRGISVVQSLSEIVKHILTESDSRSTLSKWVIQKYIENPLTISKRKFDIRQWVMVTGKYYIGLEMKCNMLQSSGTQQLFFDGRVKIGIH